jgi:hypothetical protein
MEISDDDDRRELVIEAAVRYIVIKRISKESEAKKRVQQAKSRAILQRHNRQTMFKDPDYANKKMNNLLRGHPEQFRRTTRLTMQFELLAEWLYQNT